jgi:hypothetical protein
MTRQHSAARWMRHDGVRTDGQRRDRQSRLEQIRSLLVRQRQKVDHGMLCRLVNFCEFPPTLTSKLPCFRGLGERPPGTCLFCWNHLMKRTCQLARCAPARTFILVKLSSEKLPQKSAQTKLVCAEKCANLPLTYYWEVWMSQAKTICEI